MINVFLFLVLNMWCIDLILVFVEKIVEYGMYFFYIYKYGVIFFFFLILF